MSIFSKDPDTIKHKSDATLMFALKDIKATWAENPEFEDINGPHKEYAAKLWAERDAIIVEMARRCTLELKKQYA